MATRRPLSISLDIALDGGTDAPAPVKRRGNTPQGHEDIRTGLVKKGEAPSYAREHATRIWNDAHPEEPVKSSFDDENGGFNHGEKEQPKSKRKPPKPPTKKSKKAKRKEKPVKDE